jgi:hypothetical protein
MTRYAQTNLESRRTASRAVWRLQGSTRAWEVRSDEGLPFFGPAEGGLRRSCSGSRQAWPWATSPVLSTYGGMLPSEARELTQLRVLQQGALLSRAHHAGKANTPRCS